MRKTCVALSLLLEAALAPCVAGAVTNAYYRAELGTRGGVTRLAGLVKVQNGGDVCVPGAWTVDGGPEAVAFENGRIVVKGKVAFDAGGAAFELTGRGVTFGSGAGRWQIGLDGRRTDVTKNGFTLEPHPDTPGGVTWLDFTWQSVPPALDPTQLAINRGRRIKFMHPLPRLRNGPVQCSVNNNPELAVPGVLTAQGKDIGFFMKALRDVVAANRRLIFLHGKTIVCNHNWIRDHAHQMKGWCHWERDCLSFLQLIIDTQRADGMFYELVKQLDDGHWTMVDDTSRVLFPEDNLALARLDLEADVEYVTVEAAHLYWRMTGDDRWMTSVLPKLEKAIDWQTSDPQHWNAEYGLCIRPFTIDTWDFVPMASTGPDRRIHPWEPMPAFHGDNTGVWQAMGQLAAMNERLGRADRAAAWRARADALKANIFKHLWNGRFFIHQKFLGTDKGIDDKEDERLSLSDAYALNRGILTLEQKRTIVAEYQRRRKTTSAFAEWFTIDPPYEPTFGPHKAGTYVNGAISPFTAGELAKGAFGCGYEAYGWDILQRFMKMVAKDGAVYFLYNPKGGNSTTAYMGPSAWGAAALLSAVDEGLAGIVNAGFGYDEIAFSPRWPVTPYRELRYVTGYESVGRYVDCRYVQTDEGFRYHLRSPAKKIRAHLLVPQGKTPKTLRVNGTETSFTIALVGESRYLDVVAAPQGGTVDFEVAY